MFERLKWLFTWEEKDWGIELITRLSGVTRWHILPTTRSQNLAEHTANVTLLASIIWHKMNKEGHKVPSYIDLIDTCLYHDVEEVITGDIPRPIKVAYPDLQQPGKDIFMGMAEYGLVPNYGSDAACIYWLKCCDYADAIRFIRIHGIGRVAKKSETDLRDQLARFMCGDHRPWSQTHLEATDQEEAFYTFMGLILAYTDGN